MNDFNLSKNDIDFNSQKPDCLGNRKVKIINTSFSTNRSHFISLMVFCLLSFVLMILAQHQQTKNPTQKLGWIVATSQVILFFSILAMVLIWVDYLHMKYEINPSSIQKLGSLGYAVFTSLVLFVGLSVVITSGIVGSKNPKVQSFFTFNLSIFFSVLFILFLLFWYRKKIVLNTFSKAMIYIVFLFLFIFILSYAVDNPVSLEVQ